ncbi:MAG: ribonuclease III [Acidobacteria bacterium]|nr:ribonuclease III [Acidobacteriota bacterium]
MLGIRATTPFEKRLGHRFRHPHLLELALTHRSHANERGRDEHYERLEFLGDAVLGMVTAEWLYREHPELPEGELSRLKAQLVSRAALARRAAEVALGEVLRLGVGEERSGGRSKQSLLADSLEAVFGAVYLDAGLPAAAKVIHLMLGPMLEAGEGRTQLLEADAKTRLQEISQARGGELPEYRHTGATGPDHSRLYRVEVWLDGRPVGAGEGSSKKQAEQRAAADALGRLTAAPVPQAPAENVELGNGRGRER